MENSISHVSRVLEFESSLSLTIDSRARATHNISTTKTKPIVNSKYFTLGVAFCGGMSRA